MALHHMRPSVSLLLLTESAMLTFMPTRVARCTVPECNSFGTIPDLPWEQQAAIIEEWYEEHNPNMHPDYEEVPAQDIDPNPLRERT